MRTNPPNRIHRFRLAALIVVAALVAGQASASAQTGATSGAEARDPKPGPAKPDPSQPGPPKQDPAPAFVPSEAVSSGKPVSFPTDI